MISFQTASQLISSFCTLLVPFPLNILWMEQFHIRFLWLLHKPKNTIRSENIEENTRYLSFFIFDILYDIWYLDIITCSVFISHFFSKVLSHCSLSNGVYSTSPHSETSTQNSPLCKSTNSLASRFTLSSVCPLTGYHPASSSAYDVANNAST